MSPARAFASIICIAVAIGGTMRPALAQACSHTGRLVTCDDGRRGLLSGDLIVWADGTRSIASPEPSIIGGNKPSVQVGRSKTQCVTLDGVSYCY